MGRPSGSAGPAISVTIDEVVLRGVPPERAREVLADIEATLAAHARAGRVSGEAPGLARGRAESSRRLPEVGCADAASLGRAVADAVWRELARPGRRSRPAAGAHETGGGR